MTLRVALEITGDSKDAQKALDDLSKRLDANEAAFREQASAAQGSVAAMTGVTGAAPRMGQAVRQGAGAAQGAIALNTSQLQNMQFQIQDIAQGLATGQSPFRLMAQQGSQVVQIFGPRTGVLAALRATGAAIGTFLTNPLNLALIGFVAVTGAVEFFTRRLRESRNAAEEHEGAARNLTEAIEQLDEITGRNNRTQAEQIRLSEETTRKKLEEAIATRELIKATLEAAELNVRGFGGISSPGAATAALGTIGSFRERLKEQDKLIGEAQASLRGGIATLIEADVEASLDPVRAATQEFEKARAALRKLFEDAAKPGVAADNPFIGLPEDEAEAEFKRRSEALARRRDEAIERARESGRSGRGRGRSDERDEVAELIAAQERELALLNEIDPVKRELIRLSEELAEAAPKERAEIEANVAAIEAAKEAREEKLRVDRDREAAQGIIGDLDAELQALNALDPVQREMIFLRRELAHATDDEIRKIAQKRVALDLEREAQDAAREAAEQALREQEQFARTVSGALGDIVLRGRDVEDVFLSIAESIGQAAIEALVFSALGLPLPGGNPFASPGFFGFGGQRAPENRQPASTPAGAPPAFAGGGFGTGLNVGAAGGAGAIVPPRPQSPGNLATGPDVVVGPGGGLTELAAPVFDQIGGIVGSIGNLLGGAVQSISGVLGGIVGNIGSALGSIVGSIGSALGSVLQGVLGGVGALFGIPLPFADGGAVDRRRPAAALAAAGALAVLPSSAAALGIVDGPGGPRDDAILARLSAGEFVVNAGATARNRDALEAINRGAVAAIPAFGEGGYVSALPHSVGQSGAPAQAGPQDRNVNAEARIAALLGEVLQKVGAPKIVNVNDPKIVGEYLATPEGERLIVNILRRTGHAR